ncbi:hypothetical protein E4U30_004249 [Claviceps sp. LM220 group G6]|nr:hypothetical protein E4U30_004249 [Claviceps sp. LM220 group G6]
MLSKANKATVPECLKQKFLGRIVERGESQVRAIFQQSNKNSSNSRSTSANRGKNKRSENGRSEASDYDDDDDDDDDDGQLSPVQRAVATWVGLANPDDINAGYVGGVM